MSTIGGGGLPISPLVSSTAGIVAQQRAAQASLAAQESTAKVNQAQQAAELQKLVGDVGESSQAGDRDADGREAWRWQTQEQVGEPADPPTTTGSTGEDDNAGRAINFQA